MPNQPTVVEMCFGPTGSFPHQAFLILDAQLLLKGCKLLLFGLVAIIACSKTLHKALYIKPPISLPTHAVNAMLKLFAMAQKP